MTETENKNFEILDEKTVQTIDYILRGLELGKFDDTAKRVEFLGKLSGNQTPKYIAKLLSRIKELELSEVQHSTDLTAIESRLIIIENKNNDLTIDLGAIASGLRQLFEPQPLKKSWNYQEINNFCNKHGAA